MLATYIMMTILSVLTRVEDASECLLQKVIAKQSAKALQLLLSIVGT